MLRLICRCYLLTLAKDRKSGQQGDESDAVMELVMDKTRETKGTMRYEADNEHMRILYLRKEARGASDLNTNHSRAEHWRR